MKHMENLIKSQPQSKENPTVSQQGKSDQNSTSRKKTLTKFQPQAKEGPSESQPLTNTTKINPQRQFCKIIKPSNVIPIERRILN